MTDIHTILHLNTKAIAAYEAGENECAATILIDALRLLPTALAKGNNVSTTNKDRRHGDFIRQSSDTRIRDTTIATEVISHETCRKHDMDLSDHSSSYSIHPRHPYSQDTINLPPMMQDHHESIYHGAFLIDASTGVKPKELTAVMLYNLALVMHNEGINHNRSSALNHALSFYRQASAFLSSEHQTFSSPIVYVLLAAIQTNMSHILNEFFQSDHNANEATVDRIIHLLILMECDPTIRQCDIEFFQRAATFISLTYLHFAPAA
jgi:hypothetical protein